ncbi:MAG: hypothetical protein GKR94_31455 [Gammaproteobacteria bacterium]|nr:hypothetical protein [Gammaproteobacteria bacterium]
MAWVLDASGFPKRSEIFAGHVGEPHTLETRGQALSPEHATQAPTGVLDAGMATEEKVTGSNDKPYRSVGVSRKRPRPFDANEAVLIKDHADTPIRRAACAH